jgi:hypothetical protein
VFAAGNHDLGLEIHSTMLGNTIIATGTKDEIAMCTKSGVPVQKVGSVAFRTENADHLGEDESYAPSAPSSPTHEILHGGATLAIFAAIKIVPLFPFERVM